MTTTRVRPRWLVAALLLVGACRPSLGTRARPDWNMQSEPTRASVAELRWRLPLAVTTDLDANPQHRGTPTFDPARGVVYVGALDHGVYAIRASDGAVLWRFQTLGPVEGEGVLEGGTLYIGSDDGALYAIDATSGRMRWRFGTTAQILRRPVVTADSVYFVNADDSVFSLNRVSGEQRWRFRREPPGGITGGGHAVPST
ncbi:MAG: PQQ-binding-like beta-propeller repeat protein [Polyangiales bacterium]